MPKTSRIAQAHYKCRRSNIAHINDGIEKTRKIIENIRRQFKFLRDSRGGVQVMRCRHRERSQNELRGVINDGVSIVKQPRQFSLLFLISSKERDNDNDMHMPSGKVHIASRCKATQIVYLVLFIKYCVTRTIKIVKVCKLVFSSHTVDSFQL